MELLPLRVVSINIQSRSPEVMFGAGEAVVVQTGFLLACCKRLTGVMLTEWPCGLLHFFCT